MSVLPLELTKYKKGVYILLFQYSLLIKVPFTFLLFSHYIQLMFRLLLGQDRSHNDIIWISLYDLISLANLFISD